MSEDRQKEIFFIFQRAGREIRNARLDLKLNLREFCKKYELDPVTVSKIERGLVDSPFVESLKKQCEKS